MVIGLVGAGAWISLLVIAVALCRVAAHSDDVTASFDTGRDAVRAHPRRTPAPAPAAPRESGPRIAVFPR